ncbi:MAG: glycosyltransferase [Actinobacteria bacterium]|nr:glycosyltransferase [Actinomycetota bacterium]
MKISAVVPTKNSIRTISSCLESLRNQVDAEVEVIVVDNNSDDGTADVGRELADIFISAGPERSAQRNRGFEAGTGDVVFFIDSDMVLEPRVCADIVEAFTTQPNVGAVIVPERSFGEGFLASCRELEKSLYVGDDDVEAARAFPMAVFRTIGGWDETLTAAEDWDLSDRTRALGIEFARINSWIWHDEGRISLVAQYKKKQYYGRWVAEYLARHPEAKQHISRPGVLSHSGTLIRQPLKTSGMVVLKAFEVAGLAKGMRNYSKSQRAGSAA